MGFGVPTWDLGSLWDVKGPHMGFGFPIWDLGSPYGIWGPHVM